MILPYHPASVCAIIICMKQMNVLSKKKCKIMKFQFKKMTFSHCVTFFMLFWLMNVLCIVPANAQKVHMDGKL